MYTHQEPGFELRRLEIFILVRAFGNSNITGDKRRLPIAFIKAKGQLEWERQKNPKIAGAGGQASSPVRGT